MESAQAAWRGGGRAAAGSPGAKDGGRGEGGKGAGPELVRRRVCGYRRAARILRPVRGGEGVSGDAGPSDQEIQVSPSPPPSAPGSPPSTATHCLVTICLSLTTARRGFGFVTFMDQAGVDKVLAQSRHELDSKTVSGPPGVGGPLGEGGRRRRGSGLSPEDSWMGFLRKERRKEGRSFLSRRATKLRNFVTRVGGGGERRRIPGLR